MDISTSAGGTNEHVCEEGSRPCIHENGGPQLEISGDVSVGAQSLAVYDSRARSELLWRSQQREGQCTSVHRFVYTLLGHVLGYSWK